ncbi:MAG: transposase, partial [Prevotella sp.]|nr:transposase [Prevotella sp.]
SKSVIKYKKGKGNDRLQFKFDPEKCKCCKLRDTCLSKGAKSRYYSIPIRSSEQDEQMKFSQTPEFKEKIKERYKIEQKNGILKNVYGYRMTLSFGIESMKIQGAVAIYVSNIMRILKLKEEKA